MFSIFETELNMQSDYGNHHGSNYAKFFNLIAYVRHNQLEKNYGVSVDSITERGYTLYISTAHINFIREPEEGEDIIIKTQIDNFSGGTFNVNFWVHTKNNRRLVADGYFVYSLKFTKNDLPDHFPDDLVAKLSI